MKAERGWGRVDQLTEAMHRSEWPSRSTDDGAVVFRETASRVRQVWGDVMGVEKGLRGLAQLLFAALLLVGSLPSTVMAAEAEFEAPSVLSISPMKTPLRQYKLEPNPSSLTSSTLVETSSLRLTRRYQLVIAGGLWSMLGGVTIGVVGGLLQIYDYSGPWYEQWRYDEVFEDRLFASNYVVAVGLGALAAGTITTGVGILGQSFALSRLTGRGAAATYVGGALFGASAILVTVGFATFLPGLTAVGTVLAAGGFGVVVAQSIANARAIRRLSEDDRRYIRKGKRAFRVAVAPTVERGRVGALVWGRF